MSNLVIIGNGFDLSCGLDSRYKDFFDNRYSEFLEGQKLDELKDIQKKHEEIYKLDGDMEQIKYQLDIYLKKELTDEEYTSQNRYNDELIVKQTESNNKEKERNDKINTYIYRDDFCFWDYYFILQAKFNNDDTQWSDIESEIKIAVQNAGNSSIIKNLAWYYSQYKTMKPSFNEFLKENNYDSIYEFLLAELKIFEKAFKDYLSEEVKNKKNYKAKAKELYNNIITIVNTEKKRYKINELDIILSFNYTNPISGMYEKNSAKDLVKFINNIHGNIKSDEVIFGIDGFNNTSEDMEIFTKTSRVMDKNQKDDSPLFDDGKIDIIFYGHSLSEADYSYFMSIFDYYEIYNGDVELYFVYSDYKKDGTAKKYQIKSIHKLLSKYGESFDNKAKGKNLMHKLTLEGRLHIKEIKV